MPLCEPDIGVMVRVFLTGPGNMGSVLGRVMPNTQKMVLDDSSLKNQHYKVRIKSKVEQSRERSSFSFITDSWLLNHCHYTRSVFEFTELLLEFVFLNKGDYRTEMVHIVATESEILPKLKIPLNQPDLILSLQFTYSDQDLQCSIEKLHRNKKKNQIGFRRNLSTTWTFLLSVEFEMMHV